MSKVKDDLIAKYERQIMEHNTGQLSVGKRYTLRGLLPTKRPTKMDNPAFKKSVQEITS